VTRNDDDDDDDNNNNNSLGICCEGYRARENTEALCISDASNYFMDVNDPFQFSTAYPWEKDLQYPLKIMLGSEDSFSPLLRIDVRRPSHSWSVCRLLLKINL
jgi:hypothetical protein